jgi:hypothetical protein
MKFGASEDTGQFVQPLRLLHLPVPEPVIGVLECQALVHDSAIGGDAGKLRQGAQSVLHLARTSLFQLTMGMMADGAPPETIAEAIKAFCETRSGPVN